MAFMTLGEILDQCEHCVAAKKDFEAEYKGFRFYVNMACIGFDYVTTIVSPSRDGTVLST